jgi:hypothetical protein
LKDTVNYEWSSGDADAKNVTWMIVAGDGTKAPDYQEPKFPSMIYDRDRMLNDMTLPNGWEWHNEWICPSVDATGYWATFTPENSNYSQVTKMISISVSPYILDEPIAEDKELVYNADTQTLSINGVDYDTMLVLGETGMIAGKYKAMIILTDDVNYAWRTGVPYVTIDWVILKADGNKAPGFEEPKFPKMTYAPTRTLADLSLPSGGVWDNDTLCPTVNGNGYWATFTPGDHLNYVPYSMQIELIVDPIPVNIPTAIKTSFVYSGELISLSFSGFNQMTMIAEGYEKTSVGHYTAVISLIDSNNYRWASDNEISAVMIEWSITNANGQDIPGYKEPTIAQMVYDPNRTLADIPLGIPGWTWAYDTICPTADRTGYLAKFTPDDDNYAPIEVLIPVTVIPLIVTEPSYDGAAFVHDGTEKGILFFGIDETIMTVAGNAHVTVGNYTAVVRLIDNVNYVWSSGVSELTVQWYISKGEGNKVPGFIVPILDPIVYGQNKTLANDVPLNNFEGWEWVNGGICPTVNGTGYLARFTPSDDNYSPVEVLIPVTVTKKEIPAPEAYETTFRYNGSERTLQLDGFDDELMNASGRVRTTVGNYTAVIVLKDTENYKWATDAQPEIMIEWSITKGNVYEIPGFMIPAIQQMVYDPTRTLADVPLTPGWQWNDVTICPTVNAIGYWVTFTPDDSNYASIERLIQFTVTPMLLNPPAANGTTFAFDGSLKTLVISGFDPYTMNIVGNAYTMPGKYTATITLIDNVNYAWASGIDVSISWEIEAPEIPMHAISVLTNSGGMFEYRLNGTGPFMPFSGTVFVEHGTHIEIRAITEKGFSFAWDDLRASGGSIGFIVTGDEELSGSFSVDEQKERSNIALWIVLISIIILSLLIFFLLLRRREEKEELE